MCVAFSHIDVCGLLTRDVRGLQGGDVCGLVVRIGGFTLFISRQGWWQGVMSVAFSPDGRTLATASRDHSWKLWVSSLSLSLILHAGV